MATSHAKPNLAPSHTLSSPRPDITPAVSVAIPLDVKTDQLALISDVSTPCTSQDRKLPPEIWQEIFLLCTGHSEQAFNDAMFDHTAEEPLDVSTIITSNPADALKDTPWAVSQVCGHWRAVACSTPHLWTWVHVDLQRPRLHLHRKRIDFIRQVWSTEAANLPELHFRNI
ncbi:hypothetical protein D9758_011176 [Tetrapyrgos nigripes]|uniref:F-box domain-containing protein n=1 Tax=Tetrapyrgos nigripes TaxID=182062 RepID=A0A8H5D6H1_9AGAR|nr:hypothetical protein D9758_011176 [Tetrapyrgos nigripes]